MNFEIIIDTREQTPWFFPENIKTSRGTLNAGDYALKGDDSFGIERKSLDDFVQTILKGWDRFMREMQRMDDRQFPIKVIIIEANISNIIKHNYASVINAAFVLKKCAELNFLGIQTIFCENPVMASGYAYVLFKRRYELLGN